MGRITGEGHVHFRYTPGLIAHWKNQSQEFRDYCDELGRLHGYSGMNIFFTYFIQYWTHEISGKERKAYKSEL